MKSIHIRFISLVLAIFMAVPMYADASASDSDILASVWSWGSSLVSSAWSTVVDNTVKSSKFWIGTGVFAAVVGYYLYRNIFSFQAQWEEKLRNMNFAKSPLYKETIEHALKQGLDPNNVYIGNKPIVAHVIRDGDVDLLQTLLNKVARSSSLLNSCIGLDLTSERHAIYESTLAPIGLFGEAEKVNYLGTHPLLISCIYWNQNSRINLRDARTGAETEQARTWMNKYADCAKLLIKHGASYNEDLIWRLLPEEGNELRVYLTSLEIPRINTSLVAQGIVAMNKKSKNKKSGNYVIDVTQQEKLLKSFLFEGHEYEYVSRAANIATWKPENPTPPKPKEKTERKRDGDSLSLDQ